MKKVCVFFADGFEEVEGLTVVDMLRRADVAVAAVSITDSLTVVGAHEIKIIADVLYKDVNFNDVDMLVLPGGMPGTKNLGEFLPLCELIKDFHLKGRYIAAICAAPRILGKLGVLKDKKATCFPGYEDDLLDSEFVTDRCVVDANIVTSRGMGTAIDFSAELVALLVNREKAEELKKKIMYVE
jgi:4-methyl-5(b-hydroxyethyl)-thiazole monophosphate biosynthesis